MGPTRDLLRRLGLPSEPVSFVGGEAGAIVAAVGDAAARLLIDLAGLAGPVLRGLLEDLRPR